VTQLWRETDTGYTVVDVDRLRRGKKGVKINVQIIDFLLIDFECLLYKPLIMVLIQLFAYT
jgi:hypothetical protein